MTRHAVPALVIITAVTLFSWGTLDARSARSPWPSFQGNRFNSGLSESIGPQTPTVKWKFEIEGWASPPVIGKDGVIYFGDGSGLFHALASDGRELWNLRLSTPSWPSGYSEEERQDLAIDGVIYGPQFIHSPAIAEDGTIYVGTTFHPRREDDESKSWYEANERALGVYAIAPDGTAKWFYETREDTNSSLSIGSDGNVYFRTGTLLYALRPDGSLAWTFELDGGAVWSTPAVGRDGTIYVVDRALRAITPDGKPKWSFFKGGFFDEIASFVAHPTLGVNGDIYFGTNDYVYAVKQDGSEKWKVEIGWTESSPSIAPDGTVYIGTAGLFLTKTRFYAFDPESGRIKWSFDLDQSTDVSSAIGADGTIYFGTDAGYYIALNSQGELLWKLDLGRTSVPGFGIVGAEADGAPALDGNGTLYFGNSGGPLFVQEDGYYVFFAIRDR